MAGVGSCSEHTACLCAQDTPGPDTRPRVSSDSDTICICRETLQTQTVLKLENVYCTFYSILMVCIYTNNGQSISMPPCHDSTKQRFSSRCADVRETAGANRHVSGSSWCPFIGILRDVSTVIHKLTHRMLCCMGFSCDVLFAMHNVSTKYTIRYSASAHSCDSLLLPPAHAMYTQQKEFFAQPASQ